MNKKEVLEIKKQFRPENCAITRICGCFVDFEKQKGMELKTSFLSLPEEEAFKYFEILKKTLSGNLGESLINVTLSAKEASGEDAEGFLLKLRKSKLDDDELLQKFYDRIIENYLFEENYYIILIHAMYDIPGKATDGTKMFDASDEVYEYLLCSICPVGLSKPGLCYNAADSRMEDRIRDWVVQMPDTGFLYPAFTGRQADIHNALYYTKTGGVQEELVADLFGEVPMSAKTEKAVFRELIEETLGEYCNYGIVRNIYSTMSDLLVEHNEAEPLQLGKNEVRKIFEKSGVSEKLMNSFDMNYDQMVESGKTLLVTNIINPNKFNIELLDITVKGKVERAENIEIKLVDGRKCLVIPIEGRMKVDGLDAEAI